MIARTVDGRQSGVIRCFVQLPIPLKVITSVRPRALKPAIVIPVVAGAADLGQAFTPILVETSTGVKVPLYVGAPGQQPNNTWRVNTSSVTAGYTIAITNQDIVSDTVRLAVSGATEDSGTATIDLVYKTVSGADVDFQLQVGITLARQGTDGVNGASPTPYYSSNAIGSKPSTLPPSSEWVAADALADGTVYNWIIWGTEGSDGAQAIYTFQFSGTAGERTETTPATSSSGTITVNTAADAGTGDPDIHETITLSVTGDTGTGGGFVDADDITVNGAGEDVWVRVQSANWSLAADSIFRIRFFAKVAGASGVTQGTGETYLAIAPPSGTSGRDGTAALLQEVLDNDPVRVYNLASGQKLNWTGIQIPDEDDELLFRFQTTNAIATFIDFVTVSPLNDTSTLLTSSFASQIRLQIGSVDETLDLASDLTTLADISADIRDKFNANANLRAIFNAATINSSDEVVFEHTAPGDVTLMVSYIDNSGDISGTETVVNGAMGTFTPATIRLIVPNATSSTTHDIVLASGDDSDDIAGDLTLAFASAGGYTFSTNPSNVSNYQRTATGPSSAPTISVITQGSSNLVNSHFVVDHDSGDVAVFTGTDGTVDVSIDNVSHTISIPGLTSSQIADAVRTYLNNDGRFTVTKPSISALRAVSVSQQDIDLSILLDRSTDPSGDTSVARTINQAGSRPSFEFAAIQQLRGDTGASGRYRLDIFRIGVTGTIPAEPTGGTLGTPPNLWSFSPTTPGPSETLYQSFVIIDPVSDTSTTNLGTRWSSVFISGSQGPAGTDGHSSVQRWIYNNNDVATQPNLPTANNVVNNSWVASPNPTYPWGAFQINETDLDGDIIGYGSWVGPIRTRGLDGITPSLTDNNDGTYTITNGTNTIQFSDGQNGTPGSNGSSVDIVFQRSENQPNTPAASAGVPSGWYATVNQVPDGDDSIWGAYGVKPGEQTNFTWQTPVIVEGRAGAAGASGSTAVTVFAYKKSSLSSLPTSDRPTTATTYTFATGSFTNNALGNNWYGDASLVEAGEGNIFVCVSYLLSSDSTSSTVAVPTSGWSAPQPFGASGADGRNGDNGLNGFNTVSVWGFKRGDTQPTDSPSQTRTYTFADNTWSSNSLGNGWNTRAENAGTGNNLYAVIAVASAQIATDTVLPSDWSGVFLVGERGNPGASATVSKDGNTVTITDGAGDTVTVTDGNDGADGDDIEVIYRNSTSPPFTPSASSGAPSGWSFTQTDPSGSQRTYVSIGRRASGTSAFIWGLPAVITAMDGERGPNGNRGSGIYTVTSSLSQGQLNSLSNTQLTSALTSVAGSAPVFGDILVYLGSGNAERTVRWNGSSWIAQDAFIDGNLLVTGTITSDHLAANSVTAGKIEVDNLAAISATLGNVDIDAARITDGTIDNARIGNLSANNITTGTLNGDNVNITNLDADNITSGTIQADQIRIDNITLDSDNNGALVVNHGNGIAIIGGGLGVQVDGTTIITDANGNIVAVGGTPAEFPFIGGTSSKSYSNTGGAFGVTLSARIWRFDMNLLGTNLDNVTGIELENFDMTLTGDAGSLFNNFNGNINFDLEYGTASHPTSTNLVSRVSFDGTVSGTISPTSSPQSFSTTFSSGGLVFPAPNTGTGGNNRYLFLNLTATYIQSSTTNTVEVSIPSQADTRLIIHTSGGTARSFNFNDYYL